MPVQRLKRPQNEAESEKPQESAVSLTVQRERKSGSRNPASAVHEGSDSQKQSQEASEFIRMEERGKPLSSNLFVVPDERRVSFQPLC